MSVKFMQLDLEVDATEGKKFGCSLDLDHDLVVLRAENSRGKSTVLKSMIYALGLEGMFSTNHARPLTPTVYDNVDWDGEQYGVLSSRVFLKLRNHLGRIITIKREIKCSDNSKNRIRVWEGDALSGETNSVHKDYHVRMPGSAMNEAGFHSFLADFIGVELPLVPRTDGGKGPLYLECIASTSFVEQVHGWGSILGTMPHQYRVRNSRKRVIEFTLGLDVNSMAVKKSQIKEDIATVKSRWTSLLNECDVLAESISGSFQGAPESPVVTWPPSVMPKVFMRRDAQWVDIESERERNERDLSALKDRILPTVNELTKRLTEERTIKEDRLDTMRDEMFEMRNMRATSQRYLLEVDERIKTLNEDLRHNKDEARLRDLGGDIWGDSDDAQCPTCGADLPESLLHGHEKVNVMSIEENIEYLDSEIKGLERVRLAEIRSLRAKDESLRGFSSEMESLEREIRDINDDLAASGLAPSKAAIRNQVLLEQSIARIDKCVEALKGKFLRFQRLSAEYKNLVEEQRGMSKDDLTQSDKNKLDHLTTYFRDVLKEFNFKSGINPSKISLSEDSYMPTYEGHDFTGGVSASDHIRLIWAYHLGLMETSKAKRGNHLGFLVFDEPKQQSANKESFGNLLKECFKLSDESAQLIVATSEEESDLERELDGVTSHMINIPKNEGLDYIISPIN